jgi:tetratricopeptide (TPR) repeat protein
MTDYKKMQNLKYFFFVMVCFSSLNSYSQVDSLQLAITNMSRMLSRNTFECGLGAVKYEVNEEGILCKSPAGNYTMYYVMPYGAIWCNPKDNANGEWFATNCNTSLYLKVNNNCNSCKGKYKKYMDCTDKQHDTLRVFSRYFNLAQKIQIASLPTVLEKFKDSISKFNYTFQRPTFTEEQRALAVQANYLTENKDLYGAIAKFDLCNKLNPYSFPEVYFNLALLFSKIGNFHFAILNMKKYLALKPDAEDARSAQDKIYEWELRIIN